LFKLVSIDDLRIKCHEMAAEIKEQYRPVAIFRVGSVETSSTYQTLVLHPPTGLYRFYSQLDGTRILNATRPSTTVLWLWTLDRIARCMSVQFLKIKWPHTRSWITSYNRSRTFPIVVDFEFRKYSRGLDVPAGRRGKRYSRYRRCCPLKEQR
jgi:hypothetical protein